MSETLTFLVFAPGGAQGAAASLERGGVTIIRADRPESAEDVLKLREVDFILAEFPRAADAAAVCARLRAAAGPSVPLGVVLDGAERAAAEEVRRSGADFVLCAAGDLDGSADAFIAVARFWQRLRRLEREVPARTEEMNDLRSFTDELVAALPSKLYIVDEELRILFANRSALAGTGLELRNVVGMMLSQLVPAAAEPGPLAEMIKRAFAEGFRGKLPLLRTGPPGQGERIVNIDVHPCRLAESSCVRVMLDDVTEEWKAEEDRLRESQRLQNVVDATGAGLAILDAELRFTWANRAFVNWFGPSVGKRCHEVFVRPPQECAQCAARRALQGGTFESETWQRYVAGKRLTYQNVFVRVPEQGGTYSLTVLVQDISAQADRIEQMQLIERISQAIQGVLDLDDLLHLTLTCVTAGHALGFNRAFLFLRNRETNTLDGRIAVGPASAEEAGRVWAELSVRQRSLDDALRDAALSKPTMLPLYPLVRDLRYSLDDERELVVRVFHERKPIVIRDAWSSDQVTAEFRARFRAREFVAVPLVSRGRSLGVIVADNLYNGRPITDRDVTLLQMFSGPAGLAIENAEAFADLRDSLNTLRSTRRQLVDQTKLAAIGRVAAHIAHEIRNPLTTIGGFAHSIKSRAEAVASAHASPAAAENLRKVCESASIIYEEVMRLERMLRGIMDFSRPTRPVAVRQSLNAVVERAANMLAGSLSPQVTLELALDPSTPEIAFDAEQIQQVLLNLVRNAAEAMQEAQGGGSATRKVRISTGPNGAGAVLVVSDNGPGIPKELQHRLFEPFFTTKKGGTGLGLAVCRQIVAEHGGEIHLEAAAGGGATFVITLPPQPPQAGERIGDELP